MSRRSIRESRCLITGASSGIGRALAVDLAQGGALLILNARRRDKLDELARELSAAGSQVVVAPGDVTQPDDRRSALEAASSHFGGLDVLVNNAGIGAWGRFEDANPERLRRIMEVNFFALAEMTREALPLLKQGNRPLVVNVASILGHRGIPRTSEYCASKFAVRGWSEALRPELARHGIDLLVVSPGTTQSDFTDNLIDKQGQMPWPEQPGAPASQVARATVRAMRRGLAEIIPNRRGKLLVYLNRLSPRLLDRWLKRYG